MARTEYKFKIDDIEKTNNTIQNFLSVNGFTKQVKNNEEYYRAGDAMMGYRYFSYEINNNELTIYAWLKGLTGEMGIEHNGLMKINIPSAEYKKILVPLINSLDISDSNISESPVTEIPNSNDISNQTTESPVTEVSNSNDISNFTDELTKRKETMCEVGFWLSIGGLLLSFFGVMYGIIVYMLNYYLAFQGLETKKRGKAIATIVISSISLFIVLIYIIGNIARR